MTTKCDDLLPSVTSPDGRIEVVLRNTPALTYAISFEGSSLIARSGLGLEFADGLRLGRSARVLGYEKHETSEVWRDDFGKFSSVTDHHNELRVQMREEGPRPVDFELVVRAYDDGVAWRYVLPRQDALGTFKLAEDRTEFVFTDNHRAWVGENTSYENAFPEICLAQLSDDRRSLPLVVETPGAFVAVAEADVRDWAGCSLIGTGRSGVFGARAALISTVESQTPVSSPWHAVLVGKAAGELTVSTLLKNLAAPSRIADTSWIKPGISAWDAWWTGLNPYWDEYKGLHSRGNTRSHKDYIDLAARMGWPYMLVDWYWYDQESADPETAIRPLAHIEMRELFAYAASKGVNLLLWVNSKNIASIGAEKLLRTYKQWGAAGVKIDFFPDNGSQPTQRWLEELLESAARHRLVVNFHGTYTPTGLSRTWPNLLTQEGVLGAEYVKLGRDFTPAHMLSLPFTRGLLGPADITPGAFLNVREDDFTPNSVPATVTGTRARQLALSVLVDSPLLCLCDSPGNYHDQPGLEFYRGLPTTWDETRVLEAAGLNHLVQARRKAGRWYLAAMNGDQPLSLAIPLHFLGPGQHILRAFADGPESNRRPSALVESTRTVTSGDTLSVNLAAHGGYAAFVEPEPREGKP